MNVMGRVFMDPLDDPFAAVDRELEACPLGMACDAVVIDMHAETTSENRRMGHFADGRASLGRRHAHAYADSRRADPARRHGLPCDAGMTGDYNSVIGMNKDEPLQRFTRRISSGRFEPADGPATLCGVAVEIGADGLATMIAPVRIGGRLKAAVPEEWE